MAIIREKVTKGTGIEKVNGDANICLCNEQKKKSLTKSDPMLPLSPVK